MTTPIEEAMLVKVSAEANNNKFYHVILMPDNTVTKRWGRVGSDGTSAIERSGRVGFDRLVREKTRRGYKQTDIISSNVTVQTPNNVELATVAKTVLASAKHVGNPVIEGLIDRLVKINRHEILEASGGMIKVNLDGQITTPLGLVSLNSINTAERLLGDIKTTYKAHNNVTPLLEEYLSIIPQKLARQKWQETFVSDESLLKQKEFLKQLKDSITFHDANAQAQVKAAASAADGNNVDISEKYKALFKYQIGILDNTDAKFRDIERLYTGSKNSIHSSSNLKLKRVFVLEDVLGESIYQDVLAKIGNERRLWHGTQAFNVLSILRKGLFTPPRTGNYNITGRMFGDGIYLSDQSTKSLNYAAGGVWGNTSRTNNCFMFLADVAMGHEYRPDGRFDLHHAHHGVGPRSGKPYNSINVRGGHAGVRNNEMIAFEDKQVQLRYLCEFDI